MTSPDQSRAGDGATHDLARTARSLRWGLVIGLLVLAFAFQGSRGVYEPDEGRYSGAALGMLRQHDWIHPSFDHELTNYTKPPMTYWSLAASMKSFGKNEWALRLPNALAFLLTTLCVWRLGRRLVPDRAVLAAFIYATFLLTTVAANVVTTDTLLTLWEVLAVLLFVEAWWRRDSGAWRLPILGMWAVWGLAFLTKGPPGLLPLLAIVVFLLTRPGRRRALWQLFWPPGLICFALIGFWWFALVIYQDPSLLGYFLGEEVVGRLVSSEFHRNPEWYGSLKVYLPTILLGSLPWTWILLRRVKRLPQLIRPGFWRAKSSEPEDMFLLIWLFLPLTIFFVVRSRLGLYVLPLFAPMALLMARRVTSWKWPPDRGRQLALVLWVVFLLLVRWVGAKVPTAKDDRRMAQEIQRVLPNPVNEVIWLGRGPRWGLSFYLHTEVEQIALRPGATDPMGRPLQTARSELREEGERPRLWIVHSSQATELLQIFRADGLEGRRLGEFEDRSFYLADPTPRLPPQ